LRTPTLSTVSGTTGAPVNAGDLRHFRLGGAAVLIVLPPVPRSPNRPERATRQRVAVLLAPPVVRIAQASAQMRPQAAVNGTRLLSALGSPPFHVVQHAQAAGGVGAITSIQPARLCATPPLTLNRDCFLNVPGNLEAFVVSIAKTFSASGQRAPRHQALHFLLRRE